MASQKVLIVDDGKTIRMQVKEMLPKGSFDVIEAQDGVEGLELMRKERPNLILLDFFMPKMNGWEVIEKMQAHKELLAIPLVVMSGRKDEVTAKIPQLIQLFEFIEKPFDQKALIVAMKSAMAKAKTRQAQANNGVKVAANVADKSVAGSDDIQQLKLQVKALVERNAKMQAEIEAVKKQMAQIMAFVKQKIK
ncbi:response regulator receiver protein [Crinalium epipsammum PCC 9333]|uniref:Response regulator receiver protein n=1 Tax=Crinalium epipsammum PCC 9333 TaxID=1173022 RepID=K9W371_9CYAN|nr:response regulator [Crinalium epipsammum]AFZ13885.1 response regulator receiver protein [Crinalium epipsammum PCC 9333]